MVIVPFDHAKHFNAIRRLIYKSDMDCVTHILPDISLVAIDDSKVIGYIGGHRAYGFTGFIDMFVVDPEHRNKEIGSKLGLSLMELFSALGITRFFATVETDNILAKKFYESLDISVYEINEVKGNVQDTIAFLHKRLEL